MLLTHVGGSVIKSQWWKLADKQQNMRFPITSSAVHMAEGWLKSEGFKFHNVLFDMKHFW